MSNFPTKARQTPGSERAVVTARVQSKFRLLGLGRHCQDLSGRETGNDESLLACVGDVLRWKGGAFRPERSLMLRQHAIDTGEPYQTRLNPPPAHPSLTHPAGTRPDDLLDD